MRCASHTLNLVASKDSRAALTVFAYKRLQFSTFSKCSALWRKSKRPKAAEIIESLIMCQLKTPGATRWNSLYDSVCHLLEHKSKLNEMMRLLKLPMFLNSELEFMEEFVKIMKPIAVSLDHLQGEKLMFFGELLPTLFKCRKELSELADVPLKHASELLKAVRQGLEKRFKDFFEINDTSVVRAALLATVTHPMFKLRWMSVLDTNAKQRVTSFSREILIDEIQAMNLTPNSTAENIQRERESTQNAFFTFMSDDDVSTDPVELEVMNYLSHKQFGIQTIHSYPSVKEVFLKFNVILPSSAAVERLFSYAGMILRPKRRQMSDIVFERMLLLCKRVTV